MSYGCVTDSSVWYHSDIISYGRVITLSVWDSTWLKEKCIGPSTPLYIWAFHYELLISQNTETLRWIDTVRSRNNTVQLNMIKHKTQSTKAQLLTPTFKSQHTPHRSPVGRTLWCLMWVRVCCNIYVNISRPSDAYSLCVSKLGHHSQSGLSPDHHQAIIWTNTVLLLIGPLGTKFSEIRIKIQSCAVITRCNLSRYSIRHRDNSGRNGSEFRITTDTPYLALTGELWGVYCEDFGQN